MANTIRVETIKIKDVADRIKAINEELDSTFTEIKNLVETQFSNSYTGSAAEKTADTFKQFYNKYAEQYKEAVEKYVRYLGTVELDYIEVTRHNSELGQSYLGQ